MIQSDAIFNLYISCSKNGRYIVAPYKSLYSLSKKGKVQSDAILNLYIPCSNNGRYRVKWRHHCVNWVFQIYRVVPGAKVLQCACLV